MKREKKNIKINECRHIDVCNAPLCPLDEESMKHGVWYPDEDICRYRKYRSMMFIQKQQLVAQRAIDPTKYFTLEMLNRNIVIKKGITGIDPDQEIEVADRAERKWIQDHPEKQSSSEDTASKRREWMNGMTKASTKKTGSESA